MTAFTAHLTEPTVAALDQRARSFLAEQGVSEPVYWHPPFKLLEGLDFS